MKALKNNGRHIKKTSHKRRSSVNPGLLTNKHWKNSQLSQMQMNKHRVEMERERAEKWHIEHIEF